MRLVTKGLNRNERLIIILYYYEELTMKEIGATLDLSESRVSQMHSAIVQRLQGQLGRRRPEFGSGRRARARLAFATSTELADSPRCGVGMLTLANRAYAPGVRTACQTFRRHLRLGCCRRAATPMMTHQPAIASCRPFCASGA